MFSPFLQCGFLMIIPIATFVFGVWKIIQINEKYHRISFAGLFGFVSFETSIIGMFIDPGLNNMNIQELLLTSAAIGIVIFLFVLVFLPLGMAILRIFK